MRKTVKYLLLFWLSFFIIVFVMGITRHVYTGGKQIEGKSKDVVVFLSSFLSDVRTLGENKNPQILKSTFHLKDGFNRTSAYRSNKDYLLIPSWNKKLEHSSVKLIRIRDNHVIHKWNIDLASIITYNPKPTIYGKTPPQTLENSVIQHPYLLNDGSLIFGTKPSGYSSISRVNKNGEIIWTHYPNSHHSIEQGPDGNFWICGINPNKKNALKYQFKDNTIKKIDAKTGKVIFEKSVLEILLENGYNRALLFMSNETSRSKFIDYIHLNDIQPVFFDSKHWKKGDLFISSRDQNLIFLYRPSTNKVIWSQNGPWLKQHDIEIIDSNRISIFGNNVIFSDPSKPKNKFIDGQNVLYIYDFSSKTHSTPYTSLFKSAKIETILEGRARILKNGDVWVEDSQNGRIVFGNTQKTQWSYIEKIDATTQSYFSWSRYITEEEFKKLTFISKKKK